MLDFCTFGQKMLSQEPFYGDYLSVKVCALGQIMLFLAAKLWCEGHCDWNDFLTLTTRYASKLAVDCT